MSTKKVSNQIYPSSSLPPIALVLSSALFVVLVSSAPIYADSPSDLEESTSSSQLQPVNQTSQSSASESSQSTIGSISTSSTKIVNSPIKRSASNTVIKQPVITVVPKSYSQPTKSEATQAPVLFSQNNNARASTKSSSVVNKNTVSSTYKYLSTLTTIVNQSPSASKSQAEKLIQQLSRILEERKTNSLPVYEAHLMALALGWLYQNHNIGTLKPKVLGLVQIIQLSNKKETDFTIRHTFSKKVANALLLTKKSSKFSTRYPNSELPKGFETKRTALTLAATSSIMFIGLLSGSIIIIYRKILQLIKRKKEF